MPSTGHHSSPAYLLHLATGHQAVKAWLDCLEAWDRHRSSGIGSGDQMDGLWSMAARGIRDLQQAGDAANAAGQDPSALRAVTVLLFRIMLFGEDVERFPSSVPSPVAWQASRAYLLMLSMPGAGAYGVLQPAAIGVTLNNVHAWCRNSAVFRPGGANRAANAITTTRGPSKRRRRVSVDGSADERNEDSSGDESVGGQGHGVARRDGGKAGDVDPVDEVCGILRLIKACLSSMPLASHPASAMTCLLLPYQTGVKSSVSAQLYTPRTVRAECLRALLSVQQL